MVAIYSIPSQEILLQDRSVVRVFRVSAGHGMSLRLGHSAREETKLCNLQAYALVDAEKMDKH